MNPEIAEWGLGCNSMVAELNVIDASTFESCCRLPSQIHCVFLEFNFRRLEDIHRLISSMQEATLLITPTAAAALSDFMLQGLELS